MLYTTELWCWVYLCLVANQKDLFRTFSSISSSKRFTFQNPEPERMDASSRNSISRKNWTGCATAYRESHQRSKHLPSEYLAQVWLCLLICLLIYLKSLSCWWRVNASCLLQGAMFTECTSWTNHVFLLGGTHMYGKHQMCKLRLWLCAAVDLHLFHPTWRGSQSLLIPFAGNLLHQTPSIHWNHTTTQQLLLTW